MGMWEQEQMRVAKFKELVTAGPSPFSQTGTRTGQTLREICDGIMSTQIGSLTDTLKRVCDTVFRAPEN
jgi:hypothetical protein